jgi:hypothetical protein
VPLAEGEGGEGGGGWLIVIECGSRRVKAKGREERVKIEKMKRRKGGKSEKGKK